MTDPNIQRVYGGISRERIRKMPKWLKAHLDGLAMQFADLEIDLGLARAEGEIFKPTPVDYVFRERPEVGRYGGDIHAEMLVTPGAKKPYLVRLSWWDDRTWFDDAGTPNGWCAVDGILSQMYGVPFKRDRYFKRAYDAAKYLGEVRAHADAPMIVERAKKAVEAGRTRVA